LADFQLSNCSKKKKKKGKIAAISVFERTSTKHLTLSSRWPRRGLLARRMELNLLCSLAAKYFGVEVLLLFSVGFVEFQFLQNIYVSYEADCFYQWFDAAGKESTQSQRSFS